MIKISQVERFLMKAPCLLALNNPGVPSGDEQRNAACLAAISFSVMSLRTRARRKEQRNRDIDESLKNQVQHYESRVQELAQRVIDSLRKEQAS